MNLICVALLMVMSARRTCHNKLNFTFMLTSPRFKFKFGIVSRVDVLDNQGCSSFNFNSSLIRWRNITMFLDTMTVPKNHFYIFTFYQCAEDDALSLIKWISVVPYKLGITTIFKIAWIRRFLSDFHIHTP